ncbi:Transcriptional regulatory protein RcsB [compost metagenome]
MGQVRLTKREAEIVRLFCAGATVTEISLLSHRSVQTVSSQKRSAMRKLGLERDADLIRYGADVAKSHLREGGLQALSRPDPATWSHA